MTPGASAGGALARMACQKSCHLVWCASDSIWPSGSILSQGFIGYRSPRGRGQLAPIGGGNFPGVTTAPVLYNAQVEIRQMLIDWVTEQGVIDPTTFTTYDWRLVSDGEPVTVVGAAEGGRH